jgi:glycogen synthase
VPPDVLFALTGDVRRNARAVRQLRALAGQTAARVFHASDLYTLPALAAAARRHRARLVFDARELYPDTPAVAHRPLVRAVWRAVERRYVPRADLVLTVGEGLAGEIARRYRLHQAPLVLHNAPRPHAGAPAGLHRRVGLPPDTPVVLHTGALRAGRGLHALVRAMAGLPAALVLLGGGPLAPELSRLALEAGADVRIVPPVPPADVPAYAAAATVGAVPLEDTSLNLRLSLPNKLFEYVAGDLPVVASALPELSRVVEGHGIGLTVPPGDVPALHAALARLLTDEALRTACRARISGVQQAFGSETADTRLTQAYRALLMDPDLC